MERETKAATDRLQMIKTRVPLLVALRMSNIIFTCFIWQGSFGRTETKWEVLVGDLVVFSLALVEFLPTSKPPTLGYTNYLLSELPSRHTRLRWKGTLVCPFFWLSGGLVNITALLQVLIAVTLDIRDLERQSLLDFKTRRHPADVRY